MLQSKSQAPASLISIEDVQVLTSTAARTKAAAAAPASEEARIVETLKPIYKAFCRFEDVIKAWNEQEASILNHEDMSVRQRYALLASALITTHIGLATKYDVETRLWKLGFHARIERVRSLSASDKHAAVSLGMPVISLGEEIYNAMVHSLAEETEATGALSSKMLTHYAKGTSCLADLCRYRTLLSKHLLGPTELESCWATAKSLYLQSCFLAPNNGLFYYQVALIDMQKSDNLSALYNFIRSLNVKIPFSSAKDPMIALFAANKAANELKIKADSERILRASPKRGGRGRKKGGAKSLGNIEEPVSSLFLRAFEVIFTRISLESLPDLLGLLSEATGQIQSDASMSTNRRLRRRPPHWHRYTTLIIISALARVSPESLKSTDKSSLPTNAMPAGAYATASPEVLEEIRQAMWSFADFVFRDVVASCVSHLEEDCAQGAVDQAGGGFNAENATCIGSSTPAIATVDTSVAVMRNDDMWIGLRIMLIWMKSSAGQWWLERPDVMRSTKLWTMIARLQMLAAASIARSPVPLPGEVIILEEDWLLRGFQPLKDSIHPRQSFDKYILDGGWKLKTLCELGGRTEKDHHFRFPCVITEFESVLKSLVFFKRKGDHFIFSATVEAEEIDFSDLRELSVSDDYDDVGHSSSRVTESVNKSSWLSDTLLSSEEKTQDASSLVLSNLQDRKKHLESIVYNQQDEKSQLSRSGAKEIILSVDKSFTRLLFDTNCWIDNFDEIKSLIDSGWFVIIPLVVITELDGLSTSSLESSMLASKSAQALQYLEANLQSSTLRPRNLILQTSRGTALPYLSVRTEDWSSHSAGGEAPHGSNANFSVRSIDDVLLRCCLTNHQNLLQLRGGRNISSYDGGVSTQPDGVVLVTHDVNLRLKARALGISTDGFDKLRRAVSASS